jgi:hypothetical protein
MATTSNTGAGKSANRRRSTTARRTTAARRRQNTTSTQPKTRVEQAQTLAERAVLVPVGASLVARDNLVTTVKDLTTKYRTRTGLERELKRYERRGVTARNRFERQMVRQMRRTRTRVERELRLRRNRVQRTFKQNRRRFEREVRSVRRDLEKAVSDASDRLPAVS